jgi:methylmalonyl-CoA/ethylmalonyl-CoA epimerase
MLEKLHHIGIVVRDLDQALALYEGIYGIEPSLVYESPHAKAKIAFLPLGEFRVELIQPLDAESAAGRFLGKRGEGIHHIAFAVEDIDECLSELARKGIQLIDKKSRKVRENERVGFLNPKSTHGVLTELIQED